MDPANDDLELCAAGHPDPRVHHAGFNLDHPYLEQCWAPILGPSGVAVLRHLPVLWAEDEPAHIGAGDLARSVGLGGGTGANSRLQHTLDRTTRFGLAIWIEPGRALRVYTEIPPLDPHRLARLPERSRQAHDRLPTNHIDQHHHPRRAGTDPDVHHRTPRPPPAPTGPRTPFIRGHPMAHQRHHGHPRQPIGTAVSVASEGQIPRSHICRFPYGKPAGGRGRAVS